MIGWRLYTMWFGVASLGSVSAVGLADQSAPAAARPLPVDAQPVDALPTMAAPATAAKTAIVAHRAADGLFYVTLAINRQPVRFLVDTGSTHMVLRGRDADRIGIDRHNQRPADLATAGGLQAVHWAHVDDMMINQTAIGNVDAVVADSGLPASLLGQDVLARLGPLSIDGDELTVGDTSAHR